ncbi:hypothetical protein PHMEG_000470 [Phytophthora megakarya]|uniref:FYVE-type domain-containing protein n=1 Tax=Phytophthora megakarya TaxID=4795 RepID=A0A225X472_9STRA|nr:hypothetical protein PHMEG_000470 [Phytophthora megakarya]
MAAEGFFVQHLVDSADWVADHERNLCYVCTRPFGTFRRKHHCRMCGEVVCKNCTLYKDANVDPTIGATRVRLMDDHFNAEGESGKNNPIELSSETASEWTHPWPRPPVGADEGARLRALHALSVLDSESEKPFDMICDLAKARLSCPMAAVSFLDEHRQWFKASVGLAHKMIPRKIAFCAYTVFVREPMVVLDTLQDSRFRKNPLVSGAAGVRFYAAAPIVDPNSGYAVGSVFVLDTRPREACDISILERLALAAGENLPELVSVTAETDNQQDNYDECSTEKAQQVTHLVRVVAENELESFGRRKIGAPGSPATSTTASSMSSVGSSSPSKLNCNENLEHDSMTMTQLSMGTTSAGEQMEVLLMRLLTQNTETQQQLAVQQISLSNKLGEHTDQINKLMSDYARMEAKVAAKVDGKTM